LSPDKKIQEANVYLVPRYQGKILLLKRRNTEFWEFPGGGVEWGEEPLISAKRELKEETGLVAGNFKFIGVTSATYEKGERMKHSLYFVYSADVDTDQVALSLEHEEARWVSLEEAGFMKLGLNAEDVPAML